MSYVERSPQEMARALADKFEEEFSDMLDAIAVTQMCGCEDESHGDIETTWRELIVGLRNIGPDPEQVEPPFLQIFMRLVSPIMQVATMSDEDPLDVLAGHTFRDEGNEER